MSGSTEQQPSDVKAAYIPPACAWDIREFIRAPLELIREKMVDCSTCPVFLLCESGTGGSGYVCQSCRSTGIWVDDDQDHYLMIDCRQHKFPVSSDEGLLTKCDLCSGQAVGFTFNDRGEPAMHYILTAHSTLGVEKRLAQFREADERWKAHFAKEPRHEQDGAGAPSEVPPFEE